jgi:DivIVA domain-containing protein
VPDALLADVQFAEKRNGYDPDEVDSFLRRVGEAISRLHRDLVEGSSDVRLGTDDDDFAAQLMTVRFSEAKHGYDPDQVDSFLAQVAGGIGEIENRLQESAPEIRVPIAAALFRVAIPVSDVDRAAAWYASVLGRPGSRVAPGRHYFECGSTVLACFDAPGSTNGTGRAESQGEHICFTVRDLDEAYARVKSLEPSWIEDGIEERPSGERSFYAKDPFGNPLCFVDEETVLTTSDQAR